MQPAQRVSSHTKIFHTMLKHNVMLIPLASPGFVMRREGTGVTELQQLLCLNVQCLDRHNQGHSWAWGPEVLTPPPARTRTILVRLTQIRGDFWREGGLGIG